MGLDCDIPMKSLHSHLQDKIVSLGREKYWNSEFEINMPVYHKETKIKGEALRFVNGYIEVQAGGVNEQIIVYGTTYNSLMIDN